MSQRKFKAEFQVSLGIPQVDRTATRQAVRERFRVYRYCKRMLSLDIEEHRPLVKAVKGYDKAADPSLIRAPYHYSSGIKIADDMEAANFGHDIDDDPRDRERRRLVKQVENAVKCLTEYQSAIIRKCYMDHEPGPFSPAPSDIDIWMTLYDAGYKVSERVYDEQKADAIFRLADAWGIVKFISDECV